MNTCARQLTSILIFLFTGYFSLSASAYELATHADMSTKAVKSSVLNSPDFESVLGVSANDAFDVSRADPSAPKLNNGSASGWIREGVVSEDDGTLPANHFFDPLNNTPLPAPGFATHTSPDWALEDRGIIAEQEFSYERARQYLYEALTATTNTEHDVNFGRTFETLGHVIHHIQDMAQPQHVRNDAHCDAIFPCLIPGALFGKYAPSRYEKYTDRVRDTLSFDRYLPVNAATDTNFLTTPRAFWHTENKNPRAGKGVAEFTNVNFLSAGTNYDTLRYPLPRFEDATPWEDRNINQRLESVGATVPPECLPPNQPCTMIFFRAPVTDNYRPKQSGVNDYASTVSIFDQDLKVNDVGFPVTDPETGETRIINDMFALNRFNFDAAHKFLIPRAVAYSAGLINYFFRGRLAADNVEFTDTGVRLRVKNAIDTEETPAWKDEVLYATNSSGVRGVFVLAYDYKDATGTKKYGASPPVQAKIATEGGGDIAPGETSRAAYDFAFSIPIDASDVHYRLVFRGKLGQEEDAVAVGTVEPVSGFLVTPSYLPSDGISGSRMIFRSAGAWRLSNRQGLVAGNIDWKGWYKNDRPTRVLTWWGPASRYFPFDFGNPFTGVFRQEIYQDGSVLAVTPYPVLGAALIKGNDGREWVVAICSDGANDIAFRRPAISSASPALFDPVAEPEGWVEIGRFSDPSLLLPDRPWFFNSSGTAAQALRKAQKGDDGIVSVGTKLDRLKAVVSFDNVSFERVENIGPVIGTSSFEPQQSRSEEEAENFRLVSFLGGRKFQYKEVGEYIVAVDYKKDEPVDCRVIVNNSTTLDTLVTSKFVYCGGDCFNVEEHVDEDNEQLMDEKLRCGTEEVTLNGDQEKVVTAMERTGDNFEGSRESIETEFNGGVLVADLRHNMLVSTTFETKGTAVDVVKVPNDLASQNSCTKVIGTELHVAAVTRRRVDLVRFNGSSITASDRTDTLSGEREVPNAFRFYDAMGTSDPQLDCFFLERTARPETRIYPEVFASPINGAW